MAITEYTGVFTHIDGEGNETRLYPDIKTDESLSVSGKAADAAAVGTNIGVWIGGAQYPGSGTTVTITNEAIKYNSLIDIYYNDNVKEAIANTGVDYTQTDGQLVITFGSELPYTISIQIIANIRVMNIPLI